MPCHPLQSSLLGLSTNKEDEEEDKGGKEAASRRKNLKFAAQFSMEIAGIRAMMAKTPCLRKKRGESIGICGGGSVGVEMMNNRGK